MVMNRYFLLLSIFFYPLLSSGQQIRITVPPVPEAHCSQILSLQLPDSLAYAADYLLESPNSKQRLAAQSDEAGRLFFIIEDTALLRTGSAWNLKKAPRKLKPAVRIIQTDSGLSVMAGKKPVFYYHIREAQPPADSPSYYQRSGFIHPLYSPGGQVLTDDFPVGHIHQHGLFAAWTNTSYRGQFIDFWNQHLLKGTVEHAGVKDLKDGAVFAQLRVSLHYRSLEFGPLITETWTIRIYPFQKYFVFDLSSDQVNTGSDTLFINQYHYGGMAFRGSRQWNPHDSLHFRNRWHVITSEGLQDSSANGTKARWVDAWGNIEGKPAGLAVLGSPQNFRDPQSIRVHASMPYWCYAPEVSGAFYIAPQQHYRSAFRYIVHEGPLNKAWIQAWSDSYREPVRPALRAY